MRLPDIFGGVHVARRDCSYSFLAKVTVIGCPTMALCASTLANALTRMMAPISAMS